MDILGKICEAKGETSFYYKNLVSGGQLCHNPDLPLVAASVMKLFVLTEAFRRFENGSLNRDEFVTVPRSKCYPSCGAITYLHDDFSLTVHDLCVLMIILSDNTATNMLIDILGIEDINRTIRGLGLEASVIRRKLFDSEAALRGIENVTTARDCTRWLELLYRRKIISEKASAEMLEILKNQRLNGKIPFYIHSLPNACPIAHKTGEDSGVTHDVGIIFADNPFIVCFMSNKTDVPTFERLMAEASLELFNANTWS